MTRSFCLSRRSSGLFLIGVLVLGTPVMGNEIDDFIGQRVINVELVSEGRRLDDQSVIELVETTLGMPLSMRQVRESLTHLFSLGRFQSVRVDVRQLKGGVGLRFELLPLQIIERISFHGELGFSTDDLRRAVTEGHGASFRADEAPVVSRTLRRWYRDRGFLSAMVHISIEPTDVGAELIIEVQSGERIRIDRLQVRGVSPTLYPVVLNRLGLHAGQSYDGTEVDRRLNDYEAELRNLRYYEASLSHDIDINADRASANLLLDIQRGRQITVVFEGDEIPDGNIAQLVPIEREASVDEDLLEDSDRRIAAHLHALGYRDATISHTRESDGDALLIVFRVDRGKPYHVAEVAFTGNTAVPRAILEPLLGLRLDDPLVETDLENGLASVAEHYHRLGYATIRVTPLITEIATSDKNDLVRVKCEVEITEGAKTVVRSISIEGNEFWSNTDIRASIRSRVGGPYYVPQVVEDRNTVRLLYLNNGYDQAVIAIEPHFEDDLQGVELSYRINEGPQVHVEHILVIGNERVDSSTIRQELALREGEPLGLADAVESRRRLNALGLFRRIDIREFSHGPRERRDVIVLVDEAPATRIGYGGGLEVSQRLRRETGSVGSQAVERLEFAPRGFFEIGRRNLWGKNRSIDLFTRVSLRRQNDPTDPMLVTQSSNFVFNEYRVLGTYQEPRTFGLAWDVLVTGYIEQAIRSGFDLFSRGINAQIRRRLSQTVSTNVSYRLGQNDTSNKQLNPEDGPLVDRLFPEVLLSAFSGGVVRDTRDDPFDPTRGTLVGMDGEIAARAIASEVGFAKTFLQGFIYRTIPGTARVVFAGGVRLGLAYGFPHTVGVNLEPSGTGNWPVQAFEIDASDPSLPISERFFSGGDTTVRGFALDRLGDDVTIDQDGFPKGGNAMIILNGELRVPVTTDLGLVGFLDAGNVYDRVSNMSFGRIRGGAGFGVRYRSPVGPIRVDLGFKLDRREFDNGELERRTALHISIGQAF